MKQAIFSSMLIVGLSVSVHAQNLRFWTVAKEQGDKYIVSVFAGNMKEGSQTELLKGLNLRYYYESKDLQYEGFVLSQDFVNSGFTNFGGQGNNGFREGDATRYGKADRFVGQAPFVFADGIEVSENAPVRVGTITFRKQAGVNASNIESYLIGAKIFRAMTYTALPGCPDGCPMIVIPPPATQNEGIDLEVVKFGPKYGHLTWEVASPDRVRGYVVERKTGNGEWTVLADLKSDGQYVNVYVDETAYDGVKQEENVSYRVKMLTNRGEVLSDVERIDFNAQKMLIDVYPNPASDKVQVTMTATETTGKTYLEMYATDGRLVYRREVLSGSVKEMIDLASANVDSGSYTVHLVSDGAILDVRSLHVMR